MCSLTLVENLKKVEKQIMMVISRDKLQRFYDALKTSNYLSFNNSEFSTLKLEKQWTDTDLQQIKLLRSGPAISKWAKLN